MAYYNIIAGYWCDQRHFTDAGDEFILDTVDFRHEGDMERRWTQFAHIRPQGPFNRIVGGENVQKNAWRWIGYFYGCGSTLIASDYAVTAAHCCTIPAWYFKGKLVKNEFGPRHLAEKSGQKSNVRSKK